MSVLMQYEHLHITVKPISIGLSVGKERTTGSSRTFFGVG